MAPSTNKHHKDSRVTLRIFAQAESSIPRSARTRKVVEAALAACKPRLPKLLELGSDSVAQIAAHALARSMPTSGLHLPDILCGDCGTRAILRASSLASFAENQFDDEKVQLRCRYSFAPIAKLTLVEQAAEAFELTERERIEEDLIEEGIDPRRARRIADTGDLIAAGARANLASKQAAAKDPSLSTERVVLLQAKRLTGRGVNRRNIAARIAHVTGFCARHVRRILRKADI